MPLWPAGSEAIREKRTHPYIHIPERCNDISNPKILVIFAPLFSNA